MNRLGQLLTPRILVIWASRESLQGAMTDFPFYFDTVTQKDVMEQFTKSCSEVAGGQKPVLLAYSPDWYQNPQTGVYEMEKYTYESLFQLFKEQGAFLYPVKYDDSLGGSLAHIKFDGWLIGGGRDIDPVHYNQENAGSHVYQPWANLRWDHMRHFVDKLDLAVPIFGICYGMQVLNCLFGGTMVQHLAEKSHYRKLKMNVKEGSWIEKALKAAGNQQGYMMGKCVHHQALDKIAEAFEVISTDERHNMPHAIEYKANQTRQILAVQWHPEYSYTDTRWETVDPDNASLVAYFIEICRKYSISRPVA